MSSVDPDNVSFDINYQCPRELVADRVALGKLLSRVGLSIRLAPNQYDIWCQVNTEAFRIELKPEEHFQNVVVWLPMKPRPRARNDSDQLSDAVNAVER